MMLGFTRIFARALVPQILLLALLFGSGCGSKKEGQSGGTDTAARDAAAQRPAPAEMKFDVNPALLGMSFADSSLGLRFNPPVGWPPIEADLFEKTREAYSKLARVERFTSRPVRIFSDGEKRFFMIVSEFPHWPAPVDPYVAFADYARQLQGPITDLEIDQTFYRHGRLDVYHLIIANQAMVDHRLMILREHALPVQVDYLLPRVGYPDFIKAIEASIGSFEAL